MEGNVMGQPCRLFLVGSTDSGASLMDQVGSSFPINRDDGAICECHSQLLEAEVSLLGFFHRSGGRLVGLPPDIRYAARLEQNVEKMWMSLQPYLSFSQCQQLYGLERDIKHSGTLAHKFNQLLKSMVMPALVAQAQDHVAKRIHSLACPNMPNFSYLEWLGTQTLHAIGSVPRYSVLRWTLGEDSDLWFTIRTSPDLPNTRTQSCCICGAPGRNYPLGPAKGVLCNECCPTIDPWYLCFVTDAERADFLTWSSMQVPVAPGSLDSRPAG